MVDRAPPPVCLVVGTSGGGKTTLVEKLVAIFTAQGLNVATAKGHKHPIPLDTPGKDTWRHRRAGARVTFLVTETETAAFMDRELADDPDMLAELCPPGIDLLLAEGFKTHAGRPKVLVSPLENPPFDTDVVAVVADYPVNWPGVPHFTRDDAQGVAKLILEKVGVR